MFLEPQRGGRGDGKVEICVICLAEMWGSNPVPSQVGTIALPFSPAAKARRTLTSAGEEGLTEKTSLCWRACRKFCRTLTATFVRDLGQDELFGTGEGEVWRPPWTFPCWIHLYRAWGREGLQWDLGFARFFYHDLLTISPLYSNHRIALTYTSFKHTLAP